MEAPPFPALRAALWLLAIGAAHAMPSGSQRGLPFVRTYPFNEVGDVSGEATIAFDRIGRLMVVDDGHLLVLNDETWLDLSPSEAAPAKIIRVVRDQDGTCYYGALGSFGILIPDPDGKMRLQSLVPPQHPAWMEFAEFADILCRPEGIYFSGWSDGVACWNRSTGHTGFVATRGVSHVFSFKGAIYVSSHSDGVQRLLPGPAGPGIAQSHILGNSVINHFAPLGRDLALVSTMARQVYRYDGRRLASLPAPLGGPLAGPVADIQALAASRAAIAITGVGLFIVASDGSVEASFKSPEYRRITALAENEPGVLWAVTETGVMKILYGVPATGFGQEVGLVVDWPQVVNWQDHIVAASSGRLYENASAESTEPMRFDLVADQPVAGSWGVAVWNPWLLACNSSGVFAKTPEGAFQRIAGSDASARLIMLPTGICFVVGPNEILALQCQGGVWREVAPRVKGFGYPSIVHGARHAAWIEAGPNLVGRIWLGDGHIQTQIYDHFPWARPHWVTVGSVGDTIVLCGPSGHHVFIDDLTGGPVSNPTLDRLMNQSPYPATRIQEDDRGTLWLAHEHGLVALRRVSSRYDLDDSTYRQINLHSPVIQTLAGGDVWISTARSLYRLDHNPLAQRPPGIRPIVASVRDVRSNIEFSPPNTSDFGSLTYSHSLEFRCFSSTYNFLASPRYQFQLNGHGWEEGGPGSALALSGLHEGFYDVAVRILDPSGPVGRATSIQFRIAPPWYRSWYAYSGYVMLLVALTGGVSRILLHRERARNAALEQVVAQRTHELRVTMRKLEEETRTSATLAERNRLAGEIHDSLEQGFSGLLLQLETTAGFTECPPEVKRGLAVARSMVSYSRNEVRHAVWDLHSPLLSIGGLEPALRRIVDLTVVESVQASVTVDGERRPLGSATEHHLLRMAQETVANTVKHAGSTRLDVRLGFSPEEVRLLVSDDGHGFEPSSVLASGSGHFGLQGLRARAKTIGATIEIRSRPGCGTQVEIRVPRSA